VLIAPDDDEADVEGLCDVAPLWAPPCPPAPDDAGPAAFGVQAAAAPTTATAATQTSVLLMVIPPAEVRAVRRSGGTDS